LHSGLDTEVYDLRSAEYTITTRPTTKSRQHRQKPSSAVASRLISSGAAFHDFSLSCRAQEVTSHFGHVNRFCYLLTYLLTYSEAFNNITGDARGHVHALCC